MLSGRYPLFIAVVLGMMAGLVAYSWTRAVYRTNQEGWKPVPILCALHDIEEGTEIDETMVGVCELPEKYVTESFIKAPEEETRDTLLPWGQRVIIPLKSKDPLLYSQFEARTAIPAAASVPHRMRAFGVDVSERASVDQLIQPNDHVDVVGTFRNADQKELMATTIIENVLVLATGHRTGMTMSPPEQEDRRYTHVALLVLPEEVEILMLAQEVGTLALSLRNPDDFDSHKQTGTTTVLATIFNGDKVNYFRDLREAALPRPAAPEGPVVCHGNICGPEKPDSAAKPGRSESVPPVLPRRE